MLPVAFCLQLFAVRPNLTWRPGAVGRVPGKLLLWQARVPTLACLSFCARLSNNAAMERYNCYCRCGTVYRATIKGDWDPPFMVLWPEPTTCEAMSSHIEPFLALRAALALAFIVETDPPCPSCGTITLTQRCISDKASKPTRGSV